jgi:hypothetical protein
MNPGVDALVIRGISDLVDAKASADAHGSQELAANAASAFAFELLAHSNQSHTSTASELGPDKPVKKSFQPDPRVESLIHGIGLAEWNKAADAALRVLEGTDSSSGRNELFEALITYCDCPEEDDRFWGGMNTFESCLKIAPWLLTRQDLSSLASHESFSVRAVAASICMDLAHSAPALIPLDILVRLSVYDEDWYVEAPACAAWKAMAHTFPDVLNVFFSRLQSAAPDEREHAAHHIASIAEKEPGLLDEERLTEAIRSLKPINDSATLRTLRGVLSKLSELPRPDRYRYGNHSANPV